MSLNDCCSMEIHRTDHIAGNDVSFLADDIAGPAVTKELRERLNQMSQELNAAIAMWIDDLNSYYALTQSGIGTDLIHFANQDERYNGHRFCRDDVEEPDRNNEDTWFFNLFSWREQEDGSHEDDGDELAVDDFAAELEIDPGSCSDEVDLDDDSNDHADALMCTIAKSIESGDITQDHVDATGGLPIDKESVQKTFHPRIAGFSQNLIEIEEHLRYGLPGNDFNALKDRDLRIMCMGDTITIGIGEDVDTRGYRSTLGDILKGRMTDNNDVNRVTYVGSQVRICPLMTTDGLTLIRRQNIAVDKTEAYLGANTKTLLDNIVENQVVADQQPNVVLLMIGTEDILASEGSSDPIWFAQGVLKDLIDEIFSQCINCVTIVSHVPPMT